MLIIITSASSDLEFVTHFELNIWIIYYTLFTWNYSIQSLKEIRYIVMF